MEKKRVLLADDHRIVLDGLRSLLETEFEIVGAVEDGLSLVAEARRLRPDLVVADISMPELNGIDAARQIKTFAAGIKIVFLTMHADAGYAASALEAGASGFVLKHSATQELVMALREVMLGRIYVTPILTGERMDSIRQETPDAGGWKGALSPRQREVLQLLVKGKSAKDIALILDISSRTVEFHKYRMMEQLHIKTGAELINYAVKNGLATP